MSYTTHGTNGFTSLRKTKQWLSVLLKYTGVTPGTRTDTLLIRNTRACIVSPALLTARPWHIDFYHAASIMFYFVLPASVWLHCYQWGKIKMAAPWQRSIAGFFAGFFAGTSSWEVLVEWICWGFLHICGWVGCNKLFVHRSDGWRLLVGESYWWTWIAILCQFWFISSSH